MCSRGPAGVGKPAAAMFLKHHHRCRGEEEGQVPWRRKLEQQWLRSGDDDGDGDDDNDGDGDNDGDNAQRNAQRIRRLMLSGLAAQCSAECSAD